MGKRLDVLGKTLRRFRKNVRTFQIKRFDVFSDNLSVLSDFKVLDLSLG